MKKLITILALFISSCLCAQKKDSVAPRRDTIKSYSLTMPEGLWNQLILLLKEADEKPSTIKDVITYISNNLKEEKQTTGKNK